MSYARDTYTASGSQTNFTITYPYQAESHVVVSQNSTILTQGSGNDYVFANATTIQLNTGATAGDDIVIVRETSPTTRLVDFTAGTLTEADLDNSAIQVFYLAQEAFDIADISGSLYTVTDTAPAAPLHGAIWFDTSTGRLYVYYSDADSSQWVEMGGQYTTNATTAALTTYLPAGSGATTTTVKARLDEDVSVTDFGATGDGVTDDTAAIQAALVSGALGVRFPQGSYLISGTLSLVSNQTLTLDSGCTITMNSASIALMFDFSSLTNARIEGNGATLDGNKAVTPTAIMIDLNNSIDCYIANLKIINAPSGTYGSIHVRGTASNNTLEGLKGHDAEGSFIAVDGSATGSVPTNTTISNLYVEDAAGFGVRVGKASDVTILNLTCTSNGIEAIGVTQAGTRVKVVNPDISGCGDNGISFSGTDNSCVGGVVHNNQKAGIWCWGSGNRIVGVKAYNNNLEDAGNNWAGFGASANSGGTGQDNSFVACIADDDQTSPTQWNGVRFAGVAYNSWITSTAYSAATYVYYGLHVYLIVGSGTSGATAPTHTTGEVSDGGVTWRYLTSFVGEVASSRNVSQVQISRSQSGGYFDSSNGKNQESLYSINRRIAKSAVSVAHTGDTVETTLKSVSVPANMLGAEGALKVIMSGTFTGAAGNKTMKLTFGASNAMSQIYTGGTTWTFEGMILNAATGTQRVSGQINRISDGILQHSSTLITEDTTTDLTLAIKGTLANAGDTITVLFWYVEAVGTVP